MPPPSEAVPTRSPEQRLFVGSGPRSRAWPAQLMQDTRLKACPPPLWQTMLVALSVIIVKALSLGAP